MAQGRGYLAAALATAMTVMPSLAPAQEKVMGKPAATANVELQNDKPALFRQVVNYSKEHPVVVIGVYKGQKETLLTGDQVGQKLSEVLQKGYQGTPSKYFAEPGGEYTAIIFAVNGHMYGPYGLKDSLVAIGVPADNYWSKVQRGVFPPPATASLPTESNMDGLAANPEPQQ